MNILTLGMKVHERPHVLRTLGTRTIAVLYADAHSNMEFYSSRSPYDNLRSRSADCDEKCARYTPLETGALRVQIQKCKVYMRQTIPTSLHVSKHAPLLRR